MLRMLNLSSAYKSEAAEAVFAERGHIDSSHKIIDFIVPTDE
jgi:hypothetical protein